MAVNADKPERWKADVAQSVDLYNEWFLRFAPQAFRETRRETTAAVEAALKRTANLTDVNPIVLRTNPMVLPMLRMSTAPPLARDRLIGIARVPPGLVRTMEIKRRMPPRMQTIVQDGELTKIGEIIQRLADRDVFPWLEPLREPTEAEIYRAATIVADRLCGAYADPIIRNDQERRQLATLQQWLEPRGYRLLEAGQGVRIQTMQPGTFAFRVNMPVKLSAAQGKQVNVPIDCVIMPLRAMLGELPLLIEAKSAGDFTNTNKRRKEEAQKVTHLRASYGSGVRFILFLCGYFDSGYLGYEAAEGIDWVWEHRIDDLAEFGV